MWYFDQSTGNIFHDAVLVCGAYSGFGEGKNNPAMQDVPDAGPIPCGLYSLGEPVEHSHLGSYAIPLTPDPTNKMFGRSGFYWHGDLIGQAPGHASHGCIISLRVYRQMAYESHELLMVRTGRPDQPISRKAQPDAV
jgi:hypothetical protein